MRAGRASRMLPRRGRVCYHGPMPPAHDFLHDLALVLGVAAVTTVLFRRLHQPVVLGYLLAGLIVGPHVPVPLFVDETGIHTLAELGVILVMFGIGLEFSLKRLAAVIPTAGLVGIIQVSGMLWLGFMAGQALGWSVMQSVFAAAALSISSTVIVARVFAEQGLTAPWTELVLGVLLVEDLAAVLILALLTALAGGQSGGAEAPLVVLGFETGRLALLLTAMVIGGYLVVPRAIRAVARLGSGETLLVASIGVCFALSLLAQRAGYSVAMGAFLAGTLIAESGRAEAVERLVHPVRDMFAAVFFVAVGMGVDPQAIVDHAGAVALLTLVVVLGKLVTVSVGAVLSGHDVRTAVQAGLSRAQIGEFTFIIAGVGVVTGAVGPELLPVVVAVSALTTFLTPWLVRAAEPLSRAVDRRLPHAVQTFVTLHGTWLERLRERRRSGRSPARRVVWILLVDGLLLAGLVAGTSLALEPLRSLVRARLGWDELPALWVVIGGALALAVPLLLGLVAASRRLGRLLAEQVLPPAAAGRADFGEAPRRAMLVSLQVGVLLAVLVPVVALTQPFLPLYVGLPVLLLSAVLMGYMFWRQATDLQAHVRAGAEVILDVLRRTASPATAPPRGADMHAALQVEQVLPGLGSVADIRVQPGTHADGATLRQLDLRGRTGATVVAIRRGAQNVAAPGGATQLAAGDMLAVAGTEQALEDAADLLQRPGAAPPE